MSRPEGKKRIQTSGKPEPLTGLDALFSEVPPLPPESRAVGPSLAGDPKKGRVVLRRETAHRGGKTVVVIDDFAKHHSVSLIEELGRKLRTACGTGGTVKGRQIEIQGEQVEKIRSILESEGFRVAGVRA
jgi:translation initiation factor 1